MALAVMLVIGAGLLLRSFWNLMRVDAGFDRANLTTFSLALPRARLRRQHAARRVLRSSDARTRRSAGRDRRGGDERAFRRSDR